LDNTALRSNGICAPDKHSLRNRHRLSRVAKFEMLFGKATKRREKMKAE